MVEKARSAVVNSRPSGCVAKTGAADGKVKNCIRSLFPSMSKLNQFKWHHYQPEIILLCIHWYLNYPLSYRQVAEMVNEQVLGVSHTTLFRWVPTL